MTKFKYGIEELREACRTARCATELANKLNLKQLHQGIYKKIRENNIDISHFCSPKKGFSKYYKLIGQKFNQLEVIDIFTKPKNNEKRLRYYTKCKCDCGNIVNYLPRFLKIYKCCSSCDPIPRTKKYDYYYELPLKYFYGLKQGAKQRKLEFDITKEQLWDLYIKQNKKCAITGIELDFSTASVDRIDSSKGYLIDNIQWTFRIINMIKSTLSMSDFKYLCNLVINPSDIKDNERIKEIWKIFRRQVLPSKEYRQDEIIRTKEYNKNHG